MAKDWVWKGTGGLYTAIRMDGEGRYRADLKMH